MRDAARAAAVTSRIAQAQQDAELRRASREGRLDPGLARERHLETGEVRCPVCGMLCWDVPAAARCCSGETDEHERPVFEVRPAGAVALVEDRLALLRAADELAMRRGLKSRRGLGLYPRFWVVLSRGELSWLTGATWCQLLLLFGGRVPGCRELEEGE